MRDGRAREKEQEMTFKFRLLLLPLRCCRAREEDDKNIHITRRGWVERSTPAFHTSRVIGSYSDIGELNFAFILTSSALARAPAPRPHMRDEIRDD